MQRRSRQTVAFVFITLCALSIPCSSCSANSFSVQTALQLDACPVSAENLIKESPLGPMRVSLSSLRARHGFYALDLQLQRRLPSTAQVLQVRSTIRSMHQKQELGCRMDTFVVSQARPYVTFPNAVQRSILDGMISSNKNPPQVLVDLQVRQLSGFTRSLINAVTGRGIDKDYKPSGGLQNLRNTCYMNSALQLLFSSNVVRSAVRDAEYRENTTGAALKELFASMEIGVGDPFTLAKKMNINVMVQEDSHEFLLSLFAALLESSASGLGSNPIEEAYAGEMCVTVTGPSQAGEKQRRERFVGVSLDVDGTTSIEQALQRFTAPQQVVNDDRQNMLSKQKLATQSKFSTLPPVLLFQLKRFAYEPSTGGVMKLGHEVDIPLKLDMSSYMAQSRGEEQVHQHYTLQSVVIHTGEAQIGHYYIYVRPDPQNRPDLWIKFDDTSVQQVKAAQVRSEIRGVQHSSQQAMQLFARPTGSTTAYLVQYVRDDEFAAPEQQ